MTSVQELERQFQGLAMSHSQAPGARPEVGLCFTLDQTALGFFFFYYECFFFSLNSLSLSVESSNKIIILRKLSWEWAGLLRRLPFV